MGLAQQLKEMKGNVFATPWLFFYLLLPPSCPNEGRKLWKRGCQSCISFFPQRNACPEIRHRGPRFGYMALSWIKWPFLPSESRVKGKRSYPSCWGDVGDPGATQPRPHVPMSLRCFSSMSLFSSQNQPGRWTTLLLCLHTENLSLSEVLERAVGGWKSPHQTGVTWGLR